MDKRKAEIQHKYDASSRIYDKRYTEIQHGKYREVFSKLEIEDSDIIIDIGGGTGLLLDFLNPIKSNIFSSDLSFNMLREGKKKHPHCQFICADSEVLPFRNSCADLITSFTVFQNLPNPEEALNQILPIIKDKGTLILTALQKSYKKIDLENLITRFDLKIDTIWELSIEDTSVIARK